MKLFLPSILKFQKLVSLLIIFILVTFSTFAQTEDFEGEPLGGTTFTVGGELFNATGDFLISEFANFSCGASNTGVNRYLDTGYQDGASSGVVGTIAPANAGVTFEVSTTVAQCAWTGENDGDNNLDGTIRITGTKVDNTTISEDFFIDTTIPDDELVPFTFSAGIWAGVNLKSIQIEIISPADVDFVAIDNLVFENISGLVVCPTVGAVSASETSVCVNDPFNITATGLASMDMTTNGEQDFGIEFVAFTTTPADPYIGGTSLGTIPFGSLIAGNTTAALAGTTLGTAGSYEIYAILSPAPNDATCRPSTMTTITINAIPSVTMTIPAAQDEFCVDASNEVINFSGSPTGGVYSGPGVTDLATGASFLFSPAIAGVGTHIITYTVTNNVTGCAGTATDNIVVNALPVVTLVALADLCVNDGVQNNLGGGSPTGGVYSGDGVTDDGNGMTYDFDPAAAGVGTHIITYTFTDANGCENSASDDVQVFAIPDAMFTALADLCLTDVSVTGLGGGTPTGGIYSGAGVIDDGNGMTYTFEPGTAGVGTHTITYTVGVSGCSDAAMDDVEVFALPSVTLNIPATQDEFCIDDPLTAISLAGSPTGLGVYSGPGVTDLGNSGISFTFNPAVAGVGTHTVTYTFTDGNGCMNSATDQITVNPLPIVALTALADLCINAGVQAGLGGGTPPQGTITGDMGVYSGDGVTDDGNGMTYSFDPAMAGVGVHTITYTYTNENGCTNSASDDVEVFALPVVTFTALADLCIDAGVQNNVGGGMPTGGVYSGAGVSDDGNGMTYSFDPAMAGIGTHTITYNFTNTNGCSGNASNDVEVFALPPNPDVTFPQSLCLDAGVTTLGPLCAPCTGAVYSGTGVTDNSNGVDFQFDPAVAGVGVHPVTATLTNANGCTREVIVNVTVNALPVVAFTALVDLCIDAGIQTGLGGGTPPQGTVTGDMGVYSGDGATDDGNGMTYSFDPAMAGVGAHTITYTYTDENGCTNSASDDVEVFALPLVSFTAPAPDVCIEDPAVTDLGGGMPTGGVYTGTGVTDDGNGMTFSFDPTASAPTGGNVTINYTFTDANGCSASASDDIFVNPICCEPPTISCPLNNFGLPDGCNPTVPAGTSMFNVVGGPTPNPAWPTVADGCEPLALTFTDVTNDVGCMRTVTRTYRITDDNGDFAECDQLFTFTVDTDPPVFSEMPMSTTVECDAIPIAPTITATDNCPSIEQVLFINELHYDNAGTDVGEFLEIAGSAGIDLSNYEVYAYEAFDGNFDAQVQLSGIIPNEGAGFGALAFTRVELPSGFFENGLADAIALVEIATGEVIKFISYEGTATANNGPAAGMTSVDIGVAEDGGTMPGESLQLSGMNGCPCTDFTWTGPTVASPGLINSGQSFDITSCPSTDAVPVMFSETSAPGNCPQEQTITRIWTSIDNCGNMASYTQVISVEDNTAPEFCNAPIDMTFDCEAPDAEYVGAIDNCDFSGLGNAVWINEFHYDNTGTDTDEFIEIAGVAGTNLGGYQLVTYNGANGNVDDVYDLHGMINNETCNRGALSFPAPGLQNGSPDGIALVQNGTVVEFISYEGSFTASNGPAMGMTSTDVGVTEPGTTPVGFSLQLKGSGSNNAGFTWTAPSAASPGSINIDQDIQGNLEGVLIEVDNTTPCDGGTIIRTWNAEDACGNMAIPHVQTITVLPPAAPEITCPANMTVECSADIVVNADDAMVTTFCDLGSMTVVTGPVQVGPDDCPGTTYTYTYTVTDDCGRSASCDQVFTIQNLGPIIVCPADEVVTCFEDIVADPSNLIVTTSCGMDFFAYVKQPLITGGIPGCDGTVYTYIYKVTDACGRVAECQQQFLIQNAAPTVTVPAGGNVECFSDIVVSTDDATVTADCEGDFTINILGPVISGPENCPGTTYTYRYRVKDFCNRIVETDRVFTIQNFTPPVITSVQPTLTITCLAGANPNEDFITYETSCGDDGTVNIAGPVMIGAMDCSGTIYRYTYTVTDACGRISAPVTFDYIVQNEGPVFADCEEDQWLQFNCEDYGGEDGTIAAIEAYIASVTATSACGNDLTVFNNFNSNNINTCINNGINTITFRATDNCGRTTFCTTTYVVVDTEAPTIFEEAQDHWEICNYDTPANFEAWLDSNGGANAYDGCSSENVFWSTIPANPSFNCMGASGVTSVTVTFRVRDNCGNISTTTATFNAFMANGDIVDPNNENQLDIDNSLETVLNLTAEDVNAVSPVVDFVLHQNQPNPFKNETMIGFNLPEASLASLEIFDVSGRLIFKRGGEYAKGYNQINVNRSDLPASGILYYKLNTATNSGTKKMILID